MTRNGLWVLLLIMGSHPARAIYGPDLARTNRALASYACQEGNFQQSERIAKAVASGKVEDVLQVLGSAAKEWRETPTTSPLYPARAFCLHELIPSIINLANRA